MFINSHQFPSASFTSSDFLKTKTWGLLFVMSLKSPWLCWHRQPGVGCALKDHVFVCCEHVEAPTSTSFILSAFLSVTVSRTMPDLETNYISHISLPQSHFANMQDENLLKTCVVLWKCLETNWTRNSLTMQNSQTRFHTCSFEVLALSGNLWKTFFFPGKLAEL